MTTKTFSENVGLGKQYFSSLNGAQLSHRFLEEGELLKRGGTTAKFFILCDVHRMQSNTSYKYCLKED